MATGSIKAQEAETAIMIDIMLTDMPIFVATLANNGAISAAVAVFDQFGQENDKRGNYPGSSKSGWAWLNHAVICWAITDWCRSLSRRQIKPVRPNNIKRRPIPSAVLHPASWQHR